MRIKSLLIEAQDEFGDDLGKRLVAAAMKAREVTGDPLVETYYGVRAEYLKMTGPHTTVTPGEPRRSGGGVLDG